MRFLSPETSKATDFFRGFVALPSSTIHIIYYINSFNILYYIRPRIFFNPWPGSASVKLLQLYIERTHLSIRGAKGIRVCELLLGRSPFKEKGESLVRMRGEVPSRSGNLRGTAAMNEGDGQIAQCRHDLRSRAGTQTGAIFAKGHVAHVMQSVLNGIITNDKFCLSRVRHLPKMSARKGFPQEIQYPSEATEHRCCPKAEINEKTTVEHATLHNSGSRRTASLGSSLSTAAPMERTNSIPLPSRVTITGESR